MEFNKAQREAVFASFVSTFAGIAFWLVTTTNRKLVFLSSAIYIALYLYIVRLKWRFVYGFIEIMFGVYVIYNAFEPTHQSASFNENVDITKNPLLFIQVAAAIYILIRGFDNAFQGLRKDWQEKIESRIKSWKT
jgi:hypothetical protein